MSRWTPALRVARREAARARGRSVLVLTMIALPVLGVTAADVVIHTSDISGAEAIERRIGTADARISVDPHVSKVVQAPDPEDALGQHGARRREPVSLADISAALGRDVDAVEMVTGTAMVETDAGVADIEVFETDLTHALTDGTFRVVEGRVPATDAEVAVNEDLAGRGFELGDRLQVRDGAALTVVGIAEHTLTRGRPIAVARPGAFGLRTREGQHTWLVDAGGPVTWDDVRTLNAVGATVLSRAVLLDPPARSEIPPEVATGDAGTDDAVIAVVVLVVVMALIEVVLLAGPAFAVIARRLQRSLALMAASGATPRQARRVVLASGLVLGTAGAVIGVTLGLVVAWLSLPVVQRFDDSYLGPYEVPWLHLVGIAGFGLLSALLAAVVPAWIASRQDVVAVLAGRRGDKRPSLRSPLLGLLLLGVGTAIAAYGALRGSGGEYLIAVSAIVAVLGMVLLVPVVVTVLARLARGLPLPLRYAVRDAARHRTRTVPAVAAVAATVAGVVALGIANASDAKESEMTYTPMLASGQAVVNAYGKPDWDAYGDVLDTYLPDADVTAVQGVANGGARRYTDVRFWIPGERPLLMSGYSPMGTSVPISTDGTLPASLVRLSAEERAAGERVLREGGAVVFTDRDVTAEEVRVKATAEQRRGSEVLGKATVPAVFVRTTSMTATALGVLSVPAAQAVGVTPETVGLVVDGASISEEQEQDVTEALAALGTEAGFYVERGFQAEDGTVIVLLVLFALGSVLMLGGTLTATFLSLSDARPDLATLAAVGAAPRARRAVAASYAAVIGVVGALLGAAVGFIPGIAVTYPLTGAAWVQEVDPALPSHFLDVPWLLIGSLVIALPLLTALVVGLTTRSRLPLVARID